MVTGSIAAIAYGEPRLTHDIDIIIRLTAAVIKKFRKAFPDTEYYCPPEEVIGIEIQRRHNGHFNIIHHDTGLKADCYPFTGDMLHTWAFKHCRRLEIGSDRELWTAPPEYVILRKLQYYREGGSEKHLEDIRGMLEVSGEGMDIAFIRVKSKEMGLEVMWERARSGGY